jgi:hypothetical protein
MERLTNSVAGPASSFGRTDTDSSSTPRGQQSRSPERGVVIQDSIAKSSMPSQSGGWSIIVGANAA